jgi:hypothetical protein
VAALPRMAADPRVWVPFLILAAFALAVGVVNYQRFGNALAFQDYRFYDAARLDPRRLHVVLTYGEFNFSRIGAAVLYYATGIPWRLQGVAPFADFLRARFDIIEAPPSSGLVTNPLTICLAAFGLYRLVRRPDIRPEGVAILRLALIGHAAAVMLILTVMALALRYRFDFAPFMTLAALVGYRSVALAAADAADDRRKVIRGAAVALCVLGIVGSHAMLIAHKAWLGDLPIEFRSALQPLAHLAHVVIDR